jgi:hypothetical protein
MNGPALKLGDGINFAEFALPILEGDVSLGEQRTIALPAGPSDGASDAPPTAGASVESMGVSLRLAVGASVSFDTLLYPQDAARRLRVTVLEPKDFPTAVDPKLGLGLVVAIAPAHTLLCPPGVLSVPNVPKWPPGASVTVYQHGVHISEDWAPYGGWAEVSSAVVSGDGKKIETTTPGLPELGVVGFRLTP